MNINDVPNYICKRHCSKGYELNNGAIWCDFAQSEYSKCLFTEEQIDRLVEYESLRNW